MEMGHVARRERGGRTRCALCPLSCPPSSSVSARQSTRSRTSPTPCPSRLNDSRHASIVSSSPLPPGTTPTHLCLLVLLALPLGHHGRTYLSLRSPPRAVLKPHIDSSGAILACQLVRVARAAHGTRSARHAQSSCAADCMRPPNTHTHTHTHTTMRTQGPSATCRSASSPTACPPQPTHPPRSPRPCPPPSAHGCARARVPSHVS